MKRLIGLLILFVLFIGTQGAYADWQSACQARPAGYTYEQCQSYPAIYAAQLFWLLPGDIWVMLRIGYPYPILFYDTCLSGYGGESECYQWTYELFAIQYAGNVPIELGEYFFGVIDGGNEYVCIQNVYWFLYQEKGWLHDDAVDEAENYCGQRY